MAVEFRSVNTGEHVFPGDRDPAGAAHASSIHHDRVQADKGRQEHTARVRSQTARIMERGPIAKTISGSSPPLQ